MSAPPELDAESGESAGGGRTRHRRRRKPGLAAISRYKWWHVLIAVVVALVGVGLTVALTAVHPAAIVP